VVTDGEIPIFKSKNPLFDNDDFKWYDFPGFIATNFPQATGMGTL
jgi:hypothetical protein